MDQELAQLPEDGFNNIILVVPWREFQPGMTPVHITNMPGTSWTVLWIQLRGPGTKRDAAGGIYLGLLWKGQM